MIGSVAGIRCVGENEQAKAIGDVEESIQHENKRKLRVLKLIHPNGTELIYEIGAHRPKIKPEDIEIVHQLWLELVRDKPELHHNEVVSLALQRLNQDLLSKQRRQVITQLKQ